MFGVLVSSPKLARLRLKPTFVRLNLKECQVGSFNAYQKEEIADRRIERATDRPAAAVAQVVSAAFFYCQEQETVTTTVSFPIYSRLHTATKTVWISKRGLNNQFKLWSRARHFLKDVFCLYDISLPNYSCLWRYHSDGKIQVKAYFSPLPLD